MITSWIVWLWTLDELQELMVSNAQKSYFYYYYYHYYYYLYLICIKPVKSYRQQLHGKTNQTVNTQRTYNTLLTTTLRSTSIRTFSKVVEKSVTTTNMVVSEPPKLHGQMISLGSNHSVYQDMYLFKCDFSRVQTNVVSVNLWIIIFASIDLIKDNYDV